MTHSLKEACRQLRLSGLAGSLDLRLQEANSHQLPPAQFLELLLQDELNVRDLQADQSPAEAQRTLTRYLKPDLLCIDSCSAVSNVESPWEKPMNGGVGRHLTPHY